MKEAILIIVGLSLYGLIAAGVCVWANSLCDNDDHLNSMYGMETEANLLCAVLWPAAGVAIIALRYLEIHLQRKRRLKAEEDKEFERLRKEAEKEMRGDL
jgi:hypothetical protein